MLKKFLDELEREQKSANTIMAYKTDIKQFNFWFEETIGIRTTNITSTDLKEYKQYLNNIKKLSITSINRKLKSIVRYQNYLYVIGECKDLLKVSDVLQKNSIESEHEVMIVEKSSLYKLKRTIEANGNKRDIAIYYILFGTGIRVSELVGLELDDITLTERNAKNNYSFILVRNGKGSKSRKIPLNTDVVNAIKEYLKVRPKSRTDKLLIGQRGAFSRLAINKLLDKYSRQALLDYIVTPHMARHTAFTMMIKNGVDIKTVSQLAGHSSTDVTYKYYVATTTEDKQSAVDHLNI